jgi:hypothetical protein
MSDDATTYSTDDPASVFPTVVADQQSTVVNGSEYDHSEWSVTLTLTPKEFVPGYFRYAQLPVDQHTGDVKYYTEPPPLDGIQGNWVRTQVKIREELRSLETTRC